MGRMLGSFEDDGSFDRPDLNKCPDCKCYFSGDNCPLCGKPCPDYMKAGARAAVKVKKRRSGSGNGRVTFIEWYHSWWFIALMMFIFPIAGIILLITSPYSKYIKIPLIIAACLFSVASYLGLGSYVINLLNGAYKRPVDTSLTESEYTAKCESYSAEEIYRSGDSIKGKFVKVELTVVSRNIDTDYNSDYNVYYVCTSEDGGFSILIRDAQDKNGINLKDGDSIVVYGEAAGNTTIYTENENYSLPCVNMAFVKINKNVVERFVPRHFYFRRGKISL